MQHQPWIKRLLPKSLLGRSLLIIVTPLVLLQVVAAFIFFDDHWDKVSRRLSLGVAGDVMAIADMLRRFPEPEHQRWILDNAQRHYSIQADYTPGAIMKPAGPDEQPGLMTRSLADAMIEIQDRPFRVEAERPDKRVRVRVQLADGVLTAEMSRKRLFSSTTYIFVLWMVGTSLLLLGVATVFMRNQVRPIRKLAAAANAFGKGRDISSRFKPEGALEVRQAATAFLFMRDRIKRQIQQRTDMLSGVSHDLRTPLTRMKLQLALLEGIDGTDALKGDVDEMEGMLQEYLDYARGAGGETPVDVDLSGILGDVVANARRQGKAAVDLHVEGALVLPLRVKAFRRCITNVLENAIRYGAGVVAVRAGARKEDDDQDFVEILIDDDGPGIPEDKRDDVFRPFYRLDSSRKPGTGGVGLGLSIVRDVVRSHGGEVVLEDAPIGGLRVRLRLPV